MAKVGDFTNMLTLLTGASYGASKLWTTWVAPWLTGIAPPRNAPLEELGDSLKEVLGGLASLQTAMDGLRERLDLQGENLQRQQEQLQVGWKIIFTPQVMALEGSGIREVREELLSIKTMLASRWGVVDSWRPGSLRTSSPLSWRWRRRKRSWVR